MIADLILLALALGVALTVHRNDTTMLAIFWIQSLVFFTVTGQSVYWFAYYSIMCAIFCFAVRSPWVIGLFLLQVMYCLIVAAEWDYGDYFYDVYSVFIGACFVLQLGVATFGHHIHSYYHRSRSRHRASQAAEGDSCLP